MIVGYYGKSCIQCGISTIPKIQIIGIVEKNVVIATVIRFTILYIYIFVHIYARSSINIRYIVYGCGTYTCTHIYIMVDFFSRAPSLIPSHAYPYGGGGRGGYTNFLKTDGTHIGFTTPTHTILLKHIP